jgi:hypothetical protein
VGLDERPFLIRNGVPGVVLAHLIHILAAFSAQNDCAEGGLGQIGVLDLTDAGRITSAIIIAIEAIFCRSVKGATDDLAATPTGLELIHIKAVGLFAERTDILINGLLHFEIPVFERQIHRFHCGFVKLLE